MSEPMRDEVELLSPENLKVVEDCIDMGKDDGDIATIHIDRLQAVLDGYKAALAANREKDAKIVQLRGLLASQDGAMEENCRLRSELASLRASGGEKWIDVRKTPPTAPDIDYWCYVEPRDSYYFDVPGYEHQTEKGTWKPVQKKVRTYKTKTGEIKFNCGCSEEVTYYQPLPAPPTLTRDKE